MGEEKMDTSTVNATTCEDSGSDEDSSSEEEEPQSKKPKLTSNGAVNDQKPPITPKPGSEDSESDSDSDDSGSGSGDSSSDDEKKSTVVKQEIAQKPVAKVPENSAETQSVKSEPFTPKQE